MVAVYSRTSFMSSLWVARDGLIAVYSRMSFMCSFWVGIGWDGSCVQ